MNIDFAQRLRELREDKGLSQRQMSKMLNNQITQGAIALWEQRKRVPNLDTVIMLAKFFGVSLDYIAGLED